MRVRSKAGGGARLLAIAAATAIGLAGLTACTGSSHSAASGSGSSSGSDSGFISSILKRGELRIGVALAPPEVYQDPKTQKWKGVYVDAMQYIANQLKVKLVPVSTDWNGMIAGLQAGKYDVAVGLNQTMVRSQSILYTNSLISSLTAFGVHKNRKNTWAEISSPSSTVCIVAGTAQFAAVKTLPGFKAKLDVLPSSSECQLAFASGRVDADAEDWLNLAGYSSAHSDAGIVFAPTPFALQGVAYGLPRDTSFADLATINAGLTEFTNGGQLAASLKANSVTNPLQYAVGDVPEYAKSIATGY